nr:Nonstructural protein 2 [Porcine parvovirus 1]
MAAGNTYSEEVLKATNWLQDNAQKEAFSYVFKTQKVNLNGKEIAWNNYNKDTTDVEMINLQRGAETSWDQATDMEWESEIDSLTKRLTDFHISENFTSGQQLRNNSNTGGPGFSFSLGAVERANNTNFHQPALNSNTARFSNTDTKSNLVGNRNRHKSLLW